MRRQLFPVVFSGAVGARERDLASRRLGNSFLSSYESTCDVGDAKNIPAEHIVKREMESGFLGRTLYGALMRSYLYIAEKNDPALL